MTTLAVKYKAITAILCLSPIIIKQFPILDFPLSFGPSLRAPPPPTIFCFNFNKIMRNRFAVPVWLFQWYKVRYPDGSTTRRFFSTQGEFIVTYPSIYIISIGIQTRIILPIHHFPLLQKTWIVRFI